MAAHVLLCVLTFEHVNYHTKFACYSSKRGKQKYTNIVANNHMLLGLLPTCKVMPTWLKTKFKNYYIQQYNIIMFFYLHQIRIGEGRHSPFPLLTE